MKTNDVTTIADASYRLMTEAERAELELDADRAEKVLRPALEDFLRRVLPLYSMARIQELAVEGVRAQEQEIAQLRHRLLQVVEERGALKVRAVKAEEERDDEIERCRVQRANFKKAEEDAIANGLERDRLRAELDAALVILNNIKRANELAGPALALAIQERDAAEARIRAALDLYGRHDMAAALRTEPTP